MTPFNNELQVGQPAMVINVELEKNRSEIGTIVTKVYQDEIDSLRSRSIWDMIKLKFNDWWKK